MISTTGRQGGADVGADATDAEARGGKTTEAPSSVRAAISLPVTLPTSVEVVGVTRLTDSIGEALPVAAELAPDGEEVAWLVPSQARRAAALCVASLKGGGQNCFDAIGFEGMPYRLVWSPDGKWIALSEDPAAQALESDIWLFDVSNGELVNRSDDAATGRSAEVDADFALDYLPMWDPASTGLYFWRSTPDGQGGFTLNLMRLESGDDSEPEIVRAFGRDLGDGMVRFGWQRFYLQGPAAISPDGAKLAVAIAPAQEMDVSNAHALWLIDLMNPDAEPLALANALAWQGSLPQWTNQPAVTRGLQWTADGKGLVVAALSSDLRLPLLLAHYVDVASGEVTPVVDFSDSRERDAFFRLDPATGRVPRFDVPWTMAMAPGANVLLMVTDLGGSVRMLGVPLPPTGDAPTVLYEVRSPGYEVWTRSSSGANGLVLVYGLLVQSAPLE